MLSVRAGEACLRRRLSVTTSIPSAINAEAWLCRNEWNVILGNPRLFTARCQLFVMLIGVAPRNADVVRDKIYTFATILKVFAKEAVVFYEIQCAFSIGWTGPSGPRCPEHGEAPVEPRDHEAILHGQGLPLVRDDPGSGVVAIPRGPTAACMHPHKGLKP